MVAESDPLVRLFSDIEEEHRALTSLLARLSIDRLTERPGGQWSAIDLLVHITAWQENALKVARQATGRMVNIASTGAFSYGGNGAALYSITKAAIVRMTETLAVEWSRFGINVNAIAPGAFRSEMMDGMLDRMGDITKAFPRGRLGEPHQLDSTLLYLVAPSSAAVTGTTVIVDDGQGPR